MLGESIKVCWKQKTKSLTKQTLGEILWKWQCRLGKKQMTFAQKKIKMTGKLGSIENYSFSLSITHPAWQKSITGWGRIHRPGNHCIFHLFFICFGNILFPSLLQVSFKKVRILVLVLISLNVARKTKKLGEGREEALFWARALENKMRRAQRMGMLVSQETI